jgi:hypothetical protein
MPFDPKGEAARRYSPPQCTGVKVWIQAGSPRQDRINTSFVERSNLTVRHFNKRFARLGLGWSLSKTLLRRVRHLRPSQRRRTDLLRPLRPAASRPGKRRHRHLRRRPVPRSTTAWAWSRRFSTTRKSCTIWSAHGRRPHRYSTTGSSHLRNAQPLTGDCVRGQIAIAHNGNLTNAAALRDELEDRGAMVSKPPWTAKSSSPALPAEIGGNENNLVQTSAASRAPIRWSS